MLTVGKLTGDYTTGTMTGSFTTPTLPSPTSIARHDSSLLAVNSQFANPQGEPALPFTVSDIPIPTALAATPVPKAAA